jgi:hypothetical protein
LRTEFGTEALEMLRYATMGKNTVVGFRGRDTGAGPLTDLLGTGAQQLIFQAVEAELQ